MKFNTFKFVIDMIFRKTNNTNSDDLNKILIHILKYFYLRTETDLI